MESETDTYANGKYVLGPKLGSGSFGEVFYGKDVHSQSDVAIKLEHMSGQHPQLLYEAKVLRDLQGLPGIPDVIWSGHENSHNVLVEELLGPSLGNLFKTCNSRFSLKTVFQIADQVFKRIESVHEHHIVHRDVKPDNFAMGLGKKAGTVFLIDFGLAKRYRDPSTHQHIVYREGKTLIGTARFASVNSHLGLELSRRDDLESVLYMLIYYLRGSLPWQGFSALTKQQKYDAILMAKVDVPIESLCKGSPIEFATMLKYCKELKFEERPDYAFLNGLVSNAAGRLNITMDHGFDWGQNHREKRHGGHIHKPKNQESHKIVGRRKSEVVPRDRTSNLLQKMIASELNPAAPDDSSNTTCVNTAYRPVMTLELRRKGATSVQEEVDEKERNPGCNAM